VARVGILGGTFNPPHLGHLALARNARAELGLARVLLMPAHTPPHKLPSADPGCTHRLQMCRLLAEGVEGVEACALEIERGGRSYTVDTLRHISEREPGARLVYIAGADSARTIAGWHEPERLFELADLAVGERSGAQCQEVLDALAAVRGSASISFLNAPLLEISSSRARQVAAEGGPLEHLVGPRVAAYIAEHQLYGAGSRGG
jgi:nicotinate-nucleotide adenylyltransferase